MQKRKWIRWLAVVCCLCVLPAPAALAATGSSYGSEPAIGFSGVSAPFSADLEIYPDDSEGLLEMYMLREGDTFPILVFSSEQHGDGKPEHFTLRGLDPNRQFTLVLTQRDPEESARTATFPYTNEVASMAMRGIVMPKNENGVAKTWHIYGITFQDHTMQAAGMEGLDAFLPPEDAGSLEKLMPNLFPAALASAPLFSIRLPEEPELVASVVPPAPRSTTKPPTYNPPPVPTAPPPPPSPAPVIPTLPPDDGSDTSPTPTPIPSDTPAPIPSDTPTPTPESTPTSPELCSWCGQEKEDPSQHALCLICDEGICYGNHSMCTRPNTDPKGGNHARLGCGHFECEAGNHTKCPANHWICHGSDHSACTDPLLLPLVGGVPELLTLDDPLAPFVVPPVLPPPHEQEPLPQPEPEPEPVPEIPEPTPSPQGPGPGPVPEIPEPTPSPQEPEPGPVPEIPEPTPSPPEPEPGPVLETPAPEPSPEVPPPKPEESGELPALEPEPVITPEPMLPPEEIALGAEDIPAAPPDLLQSPASYLP